MSKLTWDETAARLFETGDKKGVLYPTYNSETKRFVDGVAWNGLTAVTESPSGAEANAIYADDIKYGELRSAEEFGGTIEAYTYPDEWSQCDGSAVFGDKGGMIIGQQKRMPFGFSYVTTVGNDIEGLDYGYKIHLIYNATASPSEKSYATINDSPEAITFSWEITTTPVNVDPIGGVEYKPTANIIIDSNKVNETNLHKLEDILWGSELNDPYLPTPNEVYNILFGEAEVPVDSLELSESSVEMTTTGEGSTKTIVAVITPANATNKGIVCTSSDSAVVEVDSTNAPNIVLTAQAVGEAIVTVQSSDNESATAFCNVEVTAG